MILEESNKLSRLKRKCLEFFLVKWIQLQKMFCCCCLIHCFSTDYEYAKGFIFLALPTFQLTLSVCRVCLRTVFELWDLLKPGDCWCWAPALLFTKGVHHRYYLTIVSCWLWRHVVLELQWVCFQYSNTVQSWITAPLTLTNNYHWVESSPLWHNVNKN